MAAILAPSPHHPVVGDRRPDLRLVPGGATGPDLAVTYRRRRIVAGLLAVLERLRLLDQVASVRFASVYKEFDDPSDFARELGLLTKSTAPKPPEA